MFKKLWRSFVGTIGCLVRRPGDDRRLLCHVCALETRNRWAFYQLVYSVRGEHVCQKCGRKFAVTFTPNSVICGKFSAISHIEFHNTEKEREE